MGTSKSISEILRAALKMHKQQGVKFKPKRKVSYRLSQMLIQTSGEATKLCITLACLNKDGAINTAAVLTEDGTSFPFGSRSKSAFWGSHYGGSLQNLPKAALKHDDALDAFIQLINSKGNP